MNVEYNIGRVCVSRAGHDKGEIFMIIGLQNENYLLISDGKRRKIDKPKKKKARHVICQKEYFPEIAQKISAGCITDSDISKALKTCENPRQTTKED